MAKLPPEYAWLESDALKPLPKMVAVALSQYGVTETLGPKSTPAIMAWATECGVTDYNADAIPWCGLFMTVVASRAGKTPPKKPLWALNWGKFGEDGGQPELGDVLVFTRKNGGHVGLYIGEDNLAYHVLGGNQRDSVCMTRIAKDRIYAVRQPHYAAKPKSARTWLVSPEGDVSFDEV